MENQIRFNINNEIYSNNNNLLLDVVNRLENLLTENNLQIIIPRIKDIIIIMNKIINDLNQLMNYYRDNLSIKILSNVINKINYIINENKKNLQLLRNDISKLSQKIDNLNINNINKQEIKYSDGSKYIGQVVNGLPEGKGTWYGDDGDRYEGE